MKDRTILITGSRGQIGTELANMLKTKYTRVITSDIRPNESGDPDYLQLNVLDKNRINEVIGDYKIDHIYHLAAILSAKGEENPTLAWEVNLTGGLNVLDAAVKHKIDRVFWPSSIAVFGPQTPKEQTPQHTVTDPTTIYGITKLAGERWSYHYYSKKGLDIRSLRYPGLISYKAMPGGGTTDYAVEIFHEAIKQKRYTSFVSKDVRLPMMYMPDALRATIELMEAPAEQVKIRSAYNVGGVSFSPEELTRAICEVIPDFEIDYAPDFRDAIAQSWPSSIDDSHAQKDWGWKPEYGLKEMTEEMIRELSLLLV